MLRAVTACTTLLVLFVSFVFGMDSFEASNDNFDQISLSEVPLTTVPSSTHAGHDFVPPRLPSLWKMNSLFYQRKHYQKEAEEHLAWQIQTIEQSRPFVISGTNKYKAFQVSDSKNDVLREVRLTAHWFDWNVPFYHTLVAFADESIGINNQSHIGARGYDITYDRDAVHSIRSEVNFRPKSQHDPIQNPTSPLRRPHFEEMFLCFTPRHHEEAYQYALQFRGKYDIVRYNCHDFTAYMVEWLCGASFVRFVDMYRSAMMTFAAGMAAVFHKRKSNTLWRFHRYDADGRWDLDRSFLVSDQSHISMREALKHPALADIVAQIGMGRTDTENNYWPLIDDAKKEEESPWEFRDFLRIIGL